MVFLIVALRSRNGHSIAAAVIYATAAGTDYLDGITARITGQYSRLGALLDPLIDRVLIISAVVVCWNFSLLARWALVVLLAREVLILLLARIALTRQIALRVNLVGRWGVWPLMLAPFLAMLGARTAGNILLYIGLALILTATALYLRDGWLALRTRPSS